MEERYKNFLRKTSFSCGALLLPTIYPCEMSSIHHRIKQLREAKGLTLEAMAELVGVSWQSVQQWERENGTAPSRKRQKKAAEVLGVTVSELISDGKPETIGALADDVERKLLAQLVKLYNGLDSRGKTKLLDEAQWLYAAQHPEQSIAKPFSDMPMTDTHRMRKAGIK
jgi:transcriptional regulator with XRE-family HTH domain